MVPLLALLLQTTPAPPAPAKDIVVTGRRLDSTARTLADCIARRCPTDEDARATLAHAENQFVAGDYADARRTLQGAINRNKRFAKDHPVPVADLMRANARMNAHLGEAELARFGQIDSLVALKAGLPANDGRVLVQRMEVAAADARRGQAEPALQAYLGIAEDARRAGLPTVEGYARLRRVILLAAISASDKGYASDLKAAVRWFGDRPDLGSFKVAADLIAAQAAARKGDTAAIDALIARQGVATRRPRLLFAPVDVAQDNGRSADGGSDTNALTIDDYEGQWADVSFWVKPDGRVADVDILRAGPRLDARWVRPITARIAQRRYAPLAMAPDEPGLLRVERYTLIADLTATTRSRIRVRSSAARVEMIDLTAEPPATPGGG